MRLRKVSVIAIGLIVAVGIASTARAQGVGAIRGIATDQSGAVLPGVTVMLLNSRNHRRQSDDGNRPERQFSIPALGSGKIQHQR